MLHQKRTAENPQNVNWPVFFAIMAFFNYGIITNKPDNRKNRVLDKWLKMVYDIKKIAYK